MTSPDETPPAPEAEQLRLARLVQDSLLPPPLTLPRLDVAARYLPSTQVGGDFLDYFGLGPNYLAFYLGDVQGKGLEAALYALLISGLMRGLHKSGVEPVRVLTALDRRLCVRSVPGKFCCLSYGVFDLEQRQLKYASAGLPFPLLLRDGQATSIELTGSPVGLFSPGEFEQVVFSLQPGDRLLFYTDGLPDSFHRRSAPEHDDGREVEALFTESFQMSVGAQADAILARLHAQQVYAGDSFFDDATFLVAHVR